MPTNQPSTQPTGRPTNRPTLLPTAPTTRPTGRPTVVRRGLCIPCNADTLECDSGTVGHIERLIIASHMATAQKLVPSLSLCMMYDSGPDPFPYSCSHHGTSVNMNFTKHRMRRVIINALIGPFRHAGGNTYNTLPFYQ